MGGIRTIGIFVAAALLVACGTVSQSTGPRYTYRSVALNADFTSAYPRAVDGEIDLFDESEPRHQPLRDADEQVAAVSEPEHVPAATTTLVDPPSERRDQPDSVYFPAAAAGYVAAVYEVNSSATSDGGEQPAIIDIYRYAQENGTVYHSPRPAVGDLVFFHNTFDRNADGRNNDWYTHVGLVEVVDDEGNISVLSYLDGNVARSYLNLERAEDPRDDDGNVINTTMRRPTDDDPDYTQYLASELFAGFGSLLGDATEFLVIDNWQPGMAVAAQ